MTEVRLDALQELFEGLSDRVAALTNRLRRYLWQGWPT